MEYFYLPMLYLVACLGIAIAMPMPPHNAGCPIEGAVDGVELLLDTDMFKDYEVEGWIKEKRGDMTGAANGWSLPKGPAAMCNKEVKSCSIDRMQVIETNNVLYSSFIGAANTTYSTAIFINITYKNEQPCLDHDDCKKNFSILFNPREGNQTVFDDYDEVANLSNADTVSNIATLQFILPQNSSGFYIALQEKMSCVQVERIRVFYHVCQPSGGNRRLEMFERVPVPSESQVAPVGVTCGGNSSLSLPIGAAAAVCGDNGIIVPLAACQCNDGYYEIEDGVCTGCGQGSYLDGTSADNCTLCPDNTLTNHSNVAVCPCIADYYRSSTDTAADACTTAPGPPSNVSAVIDGTSITLQWGAPIDDGGDPSTLKYYVGYLVSVTGMQHSFIPREGVSRLVVMSSNEVTDEQPLSFSSIDRAIVVDVTDQIEMMLDDSSMSGDGASSIQVTSTTSTSASPAATASPAVVECTNVPTASRPSDAPVSYNGSPASTMAFTVYGLLIAAAIVSCIV